MTGQNDHNVAREPGANTHVIMILLQPNAKALMITIFLRNEYNYTSMITHCMGSDASTNAYNERYNIPEECAKYVSNRI